MKSDLEDKLLHGFFVFAAVLVATAFTLDVAQDIVQGWKADRLDIPKPNTTVIYKEPT